MGYAIILGSSGGVSSDELTATPEDILDGKTAYVNGYDDPVVGTMPNNSGSSFTITYPNLIALIPAGFYSGTETVSIDTKSLFRGWTHQPAATINTDKYIKANTILTSILRIKGDSNLIAKNIKKNVSIFNVTGTGEVT